MMTVQNIREKTFEKAMFGGYDMAGVDAFLEEIANELAALQKENTVLKGKMKVLVGKVEEYRGNEDALRLAILSAQKLSTMIEKEAREKSEKIVNDAMEEAAQVTREAEEEVQAEQERLKQAKLASAQYLENAEKLCRKQMEFLEKVKNTDFYRQAAEAAKEAAPAAEPEMTPAEIHETVKSIEETVAKAMRESIVTVKPDLSEVSAADSEDDDPTLSFSAAVPGEGSSNLDTTASFDFEEFLKKNGK